jgi:hypothetical protein
MFLEFLSHSMITYDCNVRYCMLLLEELKEMFKGYRLKADVALRVDLAPTSTSSFTPKIDRN